MKQYDTWMATPSNCSIQDFRYDGTNLLATARWTPETRPFTSNAMDDEFDGAAISGLWSGVNAGTSTFTVANGVLSFKPQTGGAGTFAARMTCQNLPSAPFTFVAKINFNGSFVGASNFVLGGLAVTDGTKSEFIGSKFTSGGVAQLDFSQISTLAGTPTEHVVSIPTNAQWFAIQNDNTNQNFMYSTTGMPNDYVTYATEAKTAFQTATKVCFFGDVTETTQNLTISASYFRRTQ